MKPLHFILVIGGGTVIRTVIQPCYGLRGNALKPVTQHSAASTCLYQTWPIRQQPQGSLVWVQVKQGCDSLIRLDWTFVIILLFQSDIFYVKRNANVPFMIPSQIFFTRPMIKY